MLILAFLALIPRLILGFLVIQVLWKSTDSKYLLIKLFLAEPVGIGLSSLLSFIWLWGNLDLHIYVLIETGTIAVLSAFIIWRQRAKILAFLKGKRSQTSRQNKLWGGILALSLFIFTGEFWIKSLQNPHGRWDAWSNWNVVARFVFRGGEHWVGTFLRIYDHPDYPFLLTMSNTTTWEILSRETTRGPMILGFLFTICLVGLLFSLVYALRGFPQAALAAIVLSTQPIVAYHGIAQYADMPESFYFLASLGLLPIYMVSKEKSIPILAGFLVGLSAWTKNEGLIFVLISLLAWGFLMNEKKEFAFRPFILGLVLPALIVILFKIFLAPSNDLIAGQKDTLTLLFDMERYKYILVNISNAFWVVGGGPISIIGLLAVYSIMIGKTYQSTEGLKQIIFVIFAQFLIYFFIYVTTPHDLEWHFEKSISRLYLHLFPLMLLGLFLWLKTPNELTGEKQTHAPHH